MGGMMVDAVRSPPTNRLDISTYEIPTIYPPQLNTDSY